MVRIAFLSDIVTDIVNFVDTLFQAMCKRHALKSNIAAEISNQQTMKKNLENLSQQLILLYLQLIKKSLLKEWYKSDFISSIRQWIDRTINITTYRQLNSTNILRGLLFIQQIVSDILLKRHFQIFIAVFECT